jgi:glycosyltransferase involved in cell wall biosynthesis
MRIVMLGTRGVPAAYGGFETAIEEIGQRLVAQGHEVTVYCRGAEGKPATHLGMALVHLPAARKKALETLSHTFLSVLHLLFSRRRHDVAFVFNAANAVFLPVLRLHRLPVAVHVDGLEWQRSKWGRWGRRYYRGAEALSVRWADALIADAQGIADYYTEEFGAPTELIAYGAPILSSSGHPKLDAAGLASRQYHLVVARFEPENHVLEIVRGFRRSGATCPLVVVGSAPYANEYIAAIEAAAEGDARIQLWGGVWDQDMLDQLYANAATYLHGHSVGGTNPSLLRAMGAQTPVIAFDVVFNREVLGEDGRYFSTPDDVASLVVDHERDWADTGDAIAARAARVRDRAAAHYDWDDVSRSYALLAEHLMAHRGSGRRAASGRRLRR